MELCTTNYTFNHKGDKVTLVGEKQKNDNVQISSKVKLAEGHPILLAIQGATTFQIASHSQFLHLTTQQQQLDELLNQFEDVFQKPTQLPPPRRYDYKIIIPRRYDYKIILNNDVPVSLKPYRYPHNQKSEIERQIKQLLSTGFIRESSSCYASPLVLVKKRMILGIVALI